MYKNKIYENLLFTNPSQLYIYIPHAIRNGQGETSQRVVPASSRRRRRKKKKKVGINCSRIDRIDLLVSFRFLFPFPFLSYSFFFPISKFPPISKQIHRSPRTDGRTERSAQKLCDKLSRKVNETLALGRHVCNNDHCIISDLITYP